MSKGSECKSCWGPVFNVKLGQIALMHNIQQRGPGFVLSAEFFSMSVGAHILLV
jgi:hypothetical protein